VAALAACGLLFLQLNPSADMGSAVASLPSEPRGLPEPGSEPQLPGVGVSGVGVSGVRASKASTDVSTDSQRLTRLPLHLADGSQALALSRGAAVVVERNEPDHIGLRLDTGGARFDVIPNTAREFIVRAGSVEVSVLGTIFEVERDGARVRVSVTRGKVRVRGARVGAEEAHAKGDREPSILLPGESAWFDDVPRPAHTVSDADVVPEAQAANATRERAPVLGRGPGHTVAERRERRAANKAAAVRARGGHHAAAAAQDDDAPRAAWRSLSQSGDYESAYRLLEQSAVEDDTGALLDAADAARLSDHPQAAVQYLRKVVDQHRDSPVAPLAAFTLGRVLLERLGQPSEAAESFATARALAPQGSLAQDALAREVEAWSKAGHPDEAYRCAREYVEKYPQGRRLRSVQLYGGMQAP
jgi:transmembrane sensor